MNDPRLQILKAKIDGLRSYAAGLDSHNDAVFNHVADWCDEAEAIVDGVAETANTNTSETK